MQIEKQNSATAATLRGRPRPTARSIIQAAAACFAENGFRASSIDDIAKRAGISRRTIYHHFPSKEDILRASFEQNACDLVEKLRSHVDSNLPFPEFVVESVVFIIERSPQEPLFGLNLSEELGVESLSHYFASETAVQEWVKTFQPGYIRALRERSINPDLNLAEIIEWIGRLSLSFIQHPRTSHASLPDIRSSVTRCFGNALRFSSVEG